MSHFPPQTFGGPLTNLTTVEIAQITASGDLPPSAGIVECSNSSDITIDLPPAHLMGGRVVTIKKTGNNTNTVTIDADGSDSIEGEPSIVLYVRYDFITIYSNGTVWQMMADGRIAHRAGMFSGTAQSIANATAYVQIEFDELDYDTGGLVDVANHRFVIKREGRYLVICNARLPGIDDTEEFQLVLFLNGGGVTYDVRYSSATDQLPVATVLAIMNCGAGAVVTAGIYHTEGAAINTETTQQVRPKIYISEL